MSRGNGTCSALVTNGRWHSALQQVTMPADLDGGALATVEAAGVCGSDVALAGGALGDRLFPLILGHENVVRIASADDEFCARWNVEPGDRVFVEEFVPCGHCRTCRSGHYHLCPATDFHNDRFLRYGRTPLGTSPSLWGGFAETLYLHPRVAVHPVPDAVSSTTATLAGPLANGLRWVSAVGVATPGTPVAVVGPGAHGLGCVVAAREAGAYPIVLIGLDRDEDRLRLGTELGADITLRSDTGDAIEAVRTVTGGDLASLVVDVTGSAAGSALAVRLASRTGRVVLAGGGSSGDDESIPATIVRRELRVNGVRGHDGTSLDTALGLLARGLARAAEVTTAITLDQVTGALRQMADSEAPCAAHFAVEPTGPADPDPGRHCRGTAPDAIAPYEARRETRR